MAVPKVIPLQSLKSQDPVQVHHHTTGHIQTSIVVHDPIQR